MSMDWCPGEFVVVWVWFWSMTDGDTIDTTTTKELKFFNFSISMMIVFIAKMSATSDITTNLTDNVVIAFDITKFLVNKWVGWIGWDAASIFGFFAITAGYNACFERLNLLIESHSPIFSWKLWSQAFPSISWSWSWPWSSLMVPAAASPNPTTTSFILILEMMDVRALKPIFKRRSYDSFTCISSSVWWSCGTPYDFNMLITHGLFQHQPEDSL